MENILHEDEKDKWLGAGLLVLSNLCALPAVHRLRKDNHYLTFAVVLLSMTSSMFYHFCDSKMFCFGGWSILRSMDCYFAYYSIIAVLLALVFLKPFHPPWAEAIDILFSGILLFLVLYDHSNTLLMLSPACLLLVLIICRAFCHCSDYRKNITWRWLIIGVLSSGIGEIANYLGSNKYQQLYWIFHSVWHAGIYLSVYFIFRALSHTTTTKSTAIAQTTTEDDTNSGLEMGNVGSAAPANYIPMVYTYSPDARMWVPAFAPLQAVPAQ